MAETKKKKVLIVGKSAKEHALCIKFKQCENVGEIYVVPGNDAIKEIADTADIREDNIEELLRFAVDNEIDLTVASSKIAVKKDIAGIFQANGKLIFAPTANSAEFTLNKSACKKLLYRLHIPAPHFGIFDKPQQAAEYLKTANLPVIISAEQTLGLQQVCSTFNIAKTFAEDLFAFDEKKIVIEEYLYGHTFTLYVITDGYHALPLNVIANSKFTEDGEGGLLTGGTGAFTPDYKISFNIISHIMQNVVYKILNYRRGIPYIGIIGIDCVLKDDGKYSIQNMTSFFRDHDCACVLNLLNENIYTLFEACAVGSFADDYEYIDISDNAAVSVVLSAQKNGQIIQNLEDAEDLEINHINTQKNCYLEYETQKGRILTVTSCAPTLTRARKKLYENIELIKYDGKKYRKDICPLIFE